MNDSTLLRRLALAGAILAVPACSSLCPGEPQTFVLPFDAGSAPSPGQGSCSTACVDLATAAVAQATANQAAECAFVPSLEATQDLLVDAGPAMSCNGMTYFIDTAIDGGPCQQACEQLFGPGVEVSDCSYGAGLTNVTVPIDGGPGIQCGEYPYPLPANAEGATDCTSVCLQLFADGGAQPDLQYLAPTTPPDSCQFDGPQPDGGGPASAVTCTWIYADGCGLSVSDDTTGS